jgi:phage baseplate assembly protein W
MQITEVKSTIYSMSLAAQGEIVQGIDHINQCIQILLQTRPGADPLRPEFGCDVFGKLDQPLDNSLSGAVINDVITAIRNYIPDVTVNKVVPVITVGQITVTITWSFTKEAQIREFQNVSVNYYKQVV